MDHRPDIALDRYPLMDLRPGLIAAEDVRAPNGRLLVPAGARLDQARLRVLHIWGVPEVLAIDPARPGDRDAAGPDPGPEVPEVPEVAGAAEAARAAAEERVDEHMALCDPDHEAMTMLRRLAVEELAPRLAAGSLPERRPRPGREAAAPEAYASPSIAEALGADPALVALPETFLRISEALGSPTSSSAQLAEAIGTDPSLSARLLRIVNSPMYGQSGRVDTLVRGVALVGLRELGTLALGISVMDRFRSLPETVFSLREFWEHSVAVAVLGRTIAAQAGGVPPERSFVAGLLHDIGLLLMGQNMPGPTARAADLAWRTGMALHRAEEDTFGWNHGELSHRLLTHWRVPASIAEACLGHHAPRLAGASREAAILHLADVMAELFEYGSNGARRVPPLEPEYWDLVGLAPASLALVHGRARRQIEDVLAALAC